MRSRRSNARFSMILDQVSNIARGLSRSKSVGNSDPVGKSLKELEGSEILRERPIASPF